MKTNEIKRICSLCGTDRTGKQQVGEFALVQIPDRLGKSLGLFGTCCSRAVMDAVDESPRRYGEDFIKIRERILTRAKLSANL